MYKHFYCFEGIDGSGKSTQILTFEEYLQKLGLHVVKIREPGGTEIGEQIRQILLDPKHKGKMSDIAELLLYNAARAQLIKEVIKPALESGDAVLADRFSYSTLAYQGYGRGLDIAMIKNLLKVSCGDCIPNKTFILDIPVEMSRARTSADKTRSNGADRIEQEKNDFFERVRNGYRIIAEENPKTCLLIDATQSEEIVRQKINLAMSE